MRTLLILSVALVLSVTQCPGQFFPKDALDIRGDNFKAHWYALQLRALGEPSLMLLARNKSSECYRFLWLRSFHHPVSVRVRINPDGTAILTTKIADGAGGYSPGKMSVRTYRTLTEAEKERLLHQIEITGFWSAPNPVSGERDGVDGARWIIEGVKNGKYHVIDRWSPKNGLAHDLGTLFAFDLAKLTIPKREIY